MPPTCRPTWRLGLPLMFIFLLNPLLFLAAGPGFIVNVLSRNDYLISIDYHYNYHTLPMLFAAAALGLAWMRERRFGRLAVWVLASGIVCASVVGNGLWSHLPAVKSLARIRWQLSFLRTSGVEERFERLARHLPKDPDVPISVSHNLVPRLAHRNEIYMFPNPYTPQYWGIAGENLPGHDRIEGFLIDRNALGPESGPIIERLLATGEFEIRAQEQNLFTALRRRAPGRAAMTDPLKAEPPERGARILVFLSEEEDVTWLSPLEGEAPDIDVPTERISIPTTTGRLQTAEGLDLGARDNLRLVLVGRWEAQGKEPVVFRLRADDGCKLYVDGRVAIDYHGVHSMAQLTQSKPIQLNPGEHRILVDYFEWGGEAGLNLEWAGPDGRFKVLHAGDVLP